MDSSPSPTTASSPRTSAMRRGESGFLSHILKRSQALSPGWARCARNHVGSQDVTEEYVDLEARIRNKREEEKRLLKHLADSTGKLEDILAVEKELSRVRGEAEQMEGRLRFLADRAELSTVTIEASEWKDFKPPVAATFRTQVGRTFFLSVEARSRIRQGARLAHGRARSVAAADHNRADRPALADPLRRQPAPSGHVGPGNEELSAFLRIQKSASRPDRKRRKAA